MAEFNQQPPTKRSKLTGDKEFHSIVTRVWTHYQNFIDGECCSEEEDTESSSSSGGDVDELFEIISILSSRTITPLSADISDAVVLLSNIQSLLTVMLSMTYLHLANYHMEQDDGSTDNDTSPEHYFEKSLHYWPSNPAALSLLANYHRMNNLSSIKNICKLYISASESAKFWRSIGINFLQSSIDDDDGLEGINIKELVEVLIVNGALEIDFIGEDEEGDEDANVDNKDAHNEYSCSEVECTASFMSAFLLSTMNQHDDALIHLQKFQTLTHRIHPNVWRAASSTLSHNQNKSQTTTITSPTTSTSVLFEPRIYRGNDTNGILPPDLYQSMCALFAPDAPYWKESDYQNRGYYSYFMPIEKERKERRPTNVIEDVIVSHLLPLAEQQCHESINGVEWWVHTRPTGSSLGHPLHDTDESLLAREKKVSHPMVSSVMYLTGAERDKDTKSASAGPTIVFDQTPDSTSVATKAWISKPQDNSFMIFPGNLLHGVLPCSGGCSDIEQLDRLTLMVGFWTRDVTIGMNNRRLYSACGPLPPPNLEHSWVLQSQNGYLNKTKPRREKTMSDLKSDVLACVYPAWEHFKEDDSATLTIPRGVDHRYFVSNAPHCFYNDLFQK